MILINLCIVVLEDKNKNKFLLLMNSFIKYLEKLNKKNEIKINHFEATEFNCSLILAKPSSIVVRVCLVNSKLRCSILGF